MAASDTFDNGSKTAQQANQGSASRPRVGVLFVHGIGDQPRGDTLLRFGEPLRQWLKSWLDWDPYETDDSAVTLYDTILVRPTVHELETPAHLRLRITMTAKEQAASEVTKLPDEAEFILAESRWSAVFPPPTYIQMLWWGMAVGPYLLLTTLFVWPFMMFLSALNTIRVRLVRGNSNALWVVVPILIGLFVATCYGIFAFWEYFEKPLVLLVITALVVFYGMFIFSFVVGLLMAVSLLLALIPALRGFVLAIQLRLAGSLGDSYVLTSSPLRFSAMATKVQSDLNWLSSTQNCERICVVAHSQGAAVAHEAISTSTENKVQQFITFGSGQHKLNTSRAFYRRHSQPFFAMFCLAVGAIFLSASASFPFLLIYDDDMLLSKRIMVYLSGFLPGDLMTWILVVPVLGMIMLILGVSILGPSRLASAIPKGRAVSRDELAEFEATKGLTWTDFYAVADPVPGGPLTATSKPISNRHSVLRDHTSYWENPEEFVSEVARTITNLAGLKLAATKPDRENLVAAAYRRSRRVFLLFLSGMLSVTSLLLLWNLIDPYLTSIGIPLRDDWLIHIPLLGGALGSPLIGPWVAWIVGALIIAIPVAIWHAGIVFATWRFWDGAESDRMFRRQLYSSKSFHWLLFAIASLMLPLLVTILLPAWLPIQPQTEWDGFLLASKGILLVACVGFMLLTFWLIPALPPETSTRVTPQAGQAEDSIINPP